MNAGSVPPATSATATQSLTVAARLPMGAVGSAYNGVISVSGGTPPYNVAIRGGKLPPGLSLNSTDGLVSGLPKAAGTYGFTIFVSDSSQATGQSERFAISVSPGTPTNPSVQVAVSPASLSLVSGSSYQFAAEVWNAGNAQVTWSASAGTISATGLFTAPSVSTSASVQLLATSKADPSKRGTASITVTPLVSSVPPLAITNSSLPEATEGAPYSAVLEGSGGIPPYRWKISGSLPTGLTFDATDANMGGITSQTGSFPFIAELSDANGQTASRKLSLIVAISGSGKTDGPAELPRVYMKTSLADTPAPGTMHMVKSGGNLQAALGSANCGDTIELQAGATFTGPFTLPAKPCDENHWIIVRTSAPDSALPPEGTRVTPCYAGVASLPGRPSFGCSATSNLLAKLVFSGTGSGPLLLGDGANHYRLTGLEITRTAGKATVFNLVINTNGGTSDHVIIDRSWMHGTAQDETTRGLMLTGSTYVAVIDSFFSDFHCVAVSGACVDSQAIGGGIGNNAMGPYKIVNNFLEAAGENIIFGGGGADHTAEDIEIRRNHLYKPTIWMKGQSGFVGGRDGHPFIVKNHFELKNGIRVLFEGNVLENSWGGFSQAGFSVLLTPKNQNGGCPLCVVHDVTIRFNTINHAGNGLQIGNGASDSGALSLGMWNVSIHDLVIDDIDANAYNGGGHLLQESNGNPLSVLHDIAVNHVTALSKNPKAAMLTVGNNKSYPQMYGFVWSNNILTGGGGIVTTGGGAENCAFQQGPAGVLSNCFKDSTFSHNVLIGATGKWPQANFAPASASEVRFASTASDALSNYRLQAGSPYARAATDGKDLGADVVALAAAVAGVR